MPRTAQGLGRPAALWLRRQRVRGRRKFIWGWLVPRFALPLTLGATLLRAVSEPFRWPHFLLHLGANVLGAGLLGGYIGGRLLWDLVVAPDQRSTRPRPRA